MRWHNPGPVRRSPGFIEPCLPTLSHTVPTGPQWVYEFKHDGYRFICRRDGDRVRVFSRRGNDHTDRAPGIAEALMALKVKSVTIDGEGVVCWPNGVTDFNRLRAALGRKISYRTCADFVPHGPPHATSPSERHALISGSARITSRNRRCALAL